jgi:heme exporter protein CcmD
MAIDWNAPHLGFTLAAYALTAVVLGLLVWSNLRVAAKRRSELRRLEDETAKRTRTKRK